MQDTLGTVIYKLDYAVYSDWSTWRVKAEFLRKSSATNAGRFLAGANDA